MSGQGKKNRKRHGPIMGKTRLELIEEFLAIGEKLYKHEQGCGICGIKGCEFITSCSYVAQLDRRAARILRTLAILEKRDAA